MKNFNKILIIRFSSIGDIVLATSPLKTIRKLYPNAPDWFYANIEYPYDDRYVNVSNCKVHYLFFQEQGNEKENLNKPGLIFIHGNGAHAHWYTFLAPFFVKDYNVVAISNSLGPKSFPSIKW